MTDESRPQAQKDEEWKEQLEKELAVWKEALKQENVMLEKMISSFENLEKKISQRSALSKDKNHSPDNGLPDANP